MKSKRKTFTNQLVAIVLVTVLAVSTSICFGSTSAYAAKKKTASTSSATSKPAKVTGVHAYQTSELHAVWDKTDGAKSYQVMVTYKEQVTKKTKKKVKKGKKYVWKTVKKKVWKTRTPKYSTSDTELEIAPSDLYFDSTRGVTMSVRAKSDAGYGPWSDAASVRDGYYWVPEEGHYENVPIETTKQIPHEVTVTDKEAVVEKVPRERYHCNWCNFETYDCDEMSAHIDVDQASEEYRLYTIEHPTRRGSIARNPAYTEADDMVTGGSTPKYLRTGDRTVSFSSFSEPYEKVISPAITHTETQYTTETVVTGYNQVWKVDQEGHWEQW